MALTMRRLLLTIGLAAWLAPRAAGEPAARHWRAFGNNTACSVKGAARAHDAGATENADPARVHAGAQSLDGCKALCRTTSGCGGVEYARAAGTCVLMDEAIGYAQVKAGLECWSLSERPKKVYVMLPLSVVTTEGTLAELDVLETQFEAMVTAGIDGFMVDVWWGITEPTPTAYDFAPYRQLVDMAKERSWEIQIVSSFHQCGGNVGDNCNIPLPPFVHNLDGIWYKDAEGRETKEYISLFADQVVIHDGRTPLQMYSDWFTAFAAEFAPELGNTIEEVMVGMGPCGELRYPSYRLQHWNFCGIGQFQCFDAHALASLADAAATAGHSGWALPPNASLVGNYNSRPHETNFFKEGGAYTTDGGKFFLDWYSGQLRLHGSRVLAAAGEVFGGSTKLSGKVAGIHWWYDDASHAAEVMAGYYNTNGHNAYQGLADMFATHGASLDFTCLEMRNSEQPAECKSNPEMLVDQAISAAQSAGIGFGGENALSRFDDWAYDKMLTYRDRLDAITYLRLSPALVEAENLARFTRFVTLMHVGDGQRRLEGSFESGSPQSASRRELRTEFMV